MEENNQWWLDGAPALHSYGTQLIGFDAHFINGKIDLHCCEKGYLLGLGVNNFPGKYLTKGFNPKGLYFFAEKPQFSTGDDEAKLVKETVHQQILPSLHSYRTYLSHYHDNGKDFNTIGIVVAKNNEWPFKPVLVKDAVSYIDQQLSAYPAILQKSSYSASSLKQTLDRLKPYYNEVVKLKDMNFNNAMISDGEGHSIIDPGVFINGNTGNKVFPEYFILVSATQQTIDQAKTDTPLWVYLNFPTVAGNPAQYDPAWSTGSNYLVNEVIRNFNFDYVYRWLADPEKMKSQVYKPLREPATISNTPPQKTENSSSKNKEANTILFEDFEGYATGMFSAKGWHTYGHDGHQFQNASLETVTGQSGKWISIPEAYTFYPDITRSLPVGFTVNYDILFSSTIQNKRAPMYFRLETYENDPKKSKPINLNDINRNGFQFSIALSGEAETSKQYMQVRSDEKSERFNVKDLKAGNIAHISISVNGTSVSVSVNGKEVMHDDNALPAGKAFKRYGWYCGVPGIYLGNIYSRTN
ncbi:MAG TPA: hypothetical protein VHD83_01260 [Puia sp.]|nr:hypothetical protein [Puia sp.]